METVSESLEKSIAAAVEEGRIDLAGHAALIASARRIAAVMDEPEWPMVNGKFDNVSPSAFLKYCQALGITPDPERKVTSLQNKGGVSLEVLKMEQQRRKVAR